MELTRRHVEGATVVTGLVERARRGDQLAFSELFALHVDRCYSIAYRILRDVERAEDAVQQALLLAWRDLPRLRDPDRFDAWLHRLLVNECYQHARRHRRWSVHVQALPHDVLEAGDELVAIEDREILEHGFRRLSPEQRAVFVLHHHVGMPLASIADTLAIPLGTVKSRLHYATALLRAALTEERPNDARRSGTA